LANIEWAAGAPRLKLRAGVMVMLVNHDDRTAEAPVHQRKAGGRRAERSQASRPGGVLPSAPVNKTAGTTKPSGDPRRRAPGSYTSLQGVGRALEMLEAVAEQPMRASEIADRLGLKWTTAYRSLAHLCEARYLRKDESSGIYYIGPRMHLIGEAYLINHPLLDAGGDALRSLAHSADASAQLNEREGFVSTVLLAVDPHLQIIPKTTPQFNFPLHVGSKGHVLLAYSDPGVFAELAARPLQALTDKTITDAGELYERLRQVRAQGYAITRGDVQQGTGSVAAPVFASDSELVGAVCLIVTARELTKKREAQLVSEVTNTAVQISLRLGWRHGDTSTVIHRWLA
jgi:DNA-binding IclR family transcriptional regulator